MKFKDRILSIHEQPLRANGVDILQVNMGYKCNMACKHCHVAAGANKNQEMDRATVETVLNVLKENNINCLDITGGAPELNPHFRYLVGKARDSGIYVIVRTNLTIFFEEGMEDLAEFYSKNAVEVIASLPYYTESEVDRVRGKGAFEKSIRALKKLNSLGYVGGDKKLNLVYNPSGTFLAPSQGTLEDDYKRELLKRFGITFDGLYTFANMPIGRFREYLILGKNLEKYMDKLEDAFNPLTLEGLMCKRIISIGWDGILYDCDFNQILGLTLNRDCPQSVNEFDYLRLSERLITVDEHCYGCTAGQGST
ncbi:MAG TPA: arsenosugar biosynthesis radical SAM (seleno)protein ArsS [Candidatus Sulfobium mesophilum]|nr:arsenosugar biosynthesis radical SAM (seleno)protein ArsS [Candidatus Sulfobium mesophilum]